MDQLRTLFESLGHQNVQTYVQSGNIIFSDSSVLPVHRYEEAIGDEFGVKVAFILRTAGEVRKALLDKPFAGYDTSGIHIGFMQRRPDPDTVASLDRRRFLPEEFSIVGTEAYFFLPEGVARAKVPRYLDHELEGVSTMRSWMTVTKLADLSARIDG